MRRRVPRLVTAALVPLAGWLVVRPLLTPVSLPVLSVSLGFALAGFVVTAELIPSLAPEFVRARLSGRDLLKPASKDAM